MQVITPLSFKEQACVIDTYSSLFHESFLALFTSLVIPNCDDITCGTTFTTICQVR